MFQENTMSESQQNQSYIELFDISKQESVAKAPLAGIYHLPRMGERIFLPLRQPGEWETYTVVAVEYFLGGTQPASTRPHEASGMDRITLYVERSN
jgi:hypothetical protein